MRSALLITKKAYESAYQALHVVTPELSIEKAIEVELNPSGRGLFVTKVSDSPLKAKVWGPHVVFTCIQPKEGNAFLAVDCQSCSPGQFARVFPWSKVIPGEWLITTDVRATSHADLSSQAWELVREMPFSAAQAQEFWRRWDEINAAQRERLDQLSSNEEGRFKNAWALSDQDLVAFVLADNHLSSRLAEGDTIQVRLREGADQCDSWTTVGKVTDLDTSRGMLLVRPCREEVRRLFERGGSRESLRSIQGILRIDRSGEYAIVRRQKDALNRLRRQETANSRLSDLVPDCSDAVVPECFASPPFPLSQGALTESQFRAVCGALNAPDVFLIQGPPGTGKTTVISEIVNQATRAGKTVLICSQAHVAVDNVLQRIGSLETVRAVRVGDASKVEPDCEKYLLDNAVTEWQRRIRERAQASFRQREEAWADPDLLRRRIACLRDVIEPLCRLMELRRRKAALMKRLEETAYWLERARTQEAQDATRVTLLERQAFDGRDLLREDYEEARRVMRATGWSLDELRRTVDYALACRESVDDVEGVRTSLATILGYRPTELAARMLLDRIVRVRTLARSLPHLAKTLRNFERLAELESAEEKLVRDRGTVEELQLSFERLQSELSLVEESERALWGLSSPLVVFAREFGVDPDSISSETVDWVRRESARLTEQLTLISCHDRTRDILRDWIDSLGVYQKSLEHTYLEHVNVVAATCMGIAATSNNAFVDKEFDFVIIDESARCEPLELLVPMVRGKRIVLVGDHKQLPPQRDLELEKHLETKGAFAVDELDELFGKSLFHRMYESVPEPLRVFLDVQFRMHPEISGLVKEFYANNLRDADSTYTKDHGLADQWPGHAFWIGTSGVTGNKEIHKSQVNTSYGNQADIDVIVGILEGLDSAYSRVSLSTKKSVGVITGYSYQKQLLIEALIEKRAKPWRNLDVEIDTIDGFQGREKNIVLVSLVRTNSEGRTGFIAHDPRVNVALSRAQELLFIIGDDGFIRRNRTRAGMLAVTLDRLQASGKVLNGAAFVR